jgi:branched-chain amino acid transport system permease protein
MNRFRTAISIGFIGFFLTFLFGGWSAVVAVAVTGAMTGLVYGQRSLLKNSAEIGREALVPGLVASALTVAGSFIYLFVVRPTTGQNVFYTLKLNLIGTSVQLDSVLVLVISTVLALAIGVGAAYYFATSQGLPASARTRQIIIALGVFLVVFPFVEQLTGLGWIASLITVQIYILLALGLNIVVGYAGLLDLGYAAFFAIGAYTTALLNSPRIDVQWSFWLVIWVAAGAAAVAGLILGAPTLPLRGDYLAIVTLGFGEIVPVVFRNLITVTLREPFSRFCFLGCDPKVEPAFAMQTCFYKCDGILNLTGGEAGINPIGRPIIPGLPENFFGSSSYVPWYFLILVLIVFSIFLIRRLHNSRLGRAWVAMREDELAASQMGIDPVKTKLLAFSIGATFSGFAGAFYAAQIAGIFPGVFDFSVSVIILCMVILGGLGNMIGVIIGGILIMGTDRLLLPQMSTLLNSFMKASILPNVGNPALKDFLATSLDPNQMRLALFGIVLVVMMITRPEGLVPSAERKAEFHAGDESLDGKKSKSAAAVSGD